MLDFRRCPKCGDELEVASLEELTASNYPKLGIGDNGQLLSGKWGVSEPNWESSETTGFYCTWCGEDLPDEYQDELDRVLDNRRLVRE